MTGRYYETLEVRSRTQATWNPCDIITIGHPTHTLTLTQHMVEQNHGKAENDASSKGQDHGFYQCGTCKKTYNRADHLIRHVRSHTHEKPYVCDMCGKGFARPDLLKRHVAGHEEDEKNPAGGSVIKKRKMATNFNANQASRVTQACKACAASKLKCSEGKPCERCKKKNLVCEESSPDDGSRSSPSDGHINGFQTQDGNYRSPDNGEQAVLNGPPDQEKAQASHQEAIHGRPEHVVAVANGVLERNGSYFPEFLRNVVADPGAAQTTERIESSANFNTSFFPQNHFNVGLEDGDNGWNADLWYSDGLQDAFNMPLDATFTPYSRQASDSSENSSAAGVGADAFKKSLIGSWTPSPEDSSMTERQNLVAPENVDAMPIFVESKRIMPEALSLNARDRILGMVLEACPQSAASRIIASFPSAEFLNNCIQYYFSHRHEEQIDSYIHLPTLKPNEQRAELLAMLASAGAVCTGSTVVRKLGYALQEAVRHAISRRVSRPYWVQSGRLTFPQFDENSAATRELALLQTAWLQNEVGLWSDSRRKIEIAESVTQQNATMLRRAGRFKRSPYPPIDVTEDDSGDILEKKWLDWTKQESMKRVQYHAFLHDSRVSLALHVCPVISYTELLLPLPASRELWAARSAEQWKRAFLARNLAPMPRVVGLTEALKDMSSITPCRSQIDVHYSALVLLHGLWSLVWEYQQLNEIGGPQSRYWNGLVLSSRHAELCSALQQYRLDSLKWGILCPRVRVVLELICLHLHMSVEELQLYAGKENVEEAQKVYHSARRWFDSPASRQSVWHAGQLLRAASAFTPGSLFDFFVIAVYHASMAFWSFGVVGRSDEMPSASLMMGPNAQRGPLIFLDEEETLDLPGFVAQARGVPGLTGKNGRFIPLEDTAGVMEHIADLLSSNWARGSQPPLADNVCQLMLDLGKAAKRVISS